MIVVARVRSALLLLIYPGLLPYVAEIISGVAGLTGSCCSETLLPFRPPMLPMRDAPLLLIFVMRDAPLLFVKLDVEEVEKEGLLTI
jgi:hypothetical protein